MDHEYLKILRQDVEKAGLTKRVRFLGYRNDIPALLSLLDIFIHASVSPEPFGMVLLEAMAAKVPVIATNIGGPIEILDGGKCGALVPPKDGESIAAECIKYFSDEDYRKHTTEKAYARLCGEFNINNTVRNVEQLLESTIRKNRASVG